MIMNQNPALPILYWEILPSYNTIFFFISKFCSFFFLPALLSSNSKFYPIIPVFTSYHWPNFKTISIPFTTDIVENLRVLGFISKCTVCKTWFRTKLKRQNLTTTFRLIKLCRMFPSLERLLLRTEKIKWNAIPIRKMPQVFNFAINAKFENHNQFIHFSFINNLIIHLLHYSENSNNHYWKINK